MTKGNEGGATVHTIAGTPSEVGAQVWERFCLPVLVATRGRPPEQVAQFYAGVVSSAFGAMAADFGHELATQIAQRLVDSFAGMADELAGSVRQ